MRVNETKEIISLLKTEDLIIVCGEEGCGKTTILKDISSKLKNSTYFELVSLSRLVKVIGNKVNVKEKNMLDAIKKINSKRTKSKLILLIDNYNIYDYRFKKFLALIDCKKIIASTKKEKGFVYEIRPLDLEKTLNYVSKKIEDPYIVRGIINSSGGNVSRIVALTDEVKNKSKKEAISIIKKQKPIIRKEPLIKMKSLFIIIYFLLFLRFIFYLNNNFREGFILASIGYFLMIITRINN